MHEVPAAACKNCGATITGTFCSQCGEKVYSDHDKSLAHIFEEFFHFITHFDSKFFTTLYLVFARPGFVSKEFCAGIRNKYFKPFSLFLIGVVIYLIFPLLQGLNISFRNHLSQDNTLHIGFAQQWVDAKVAHKYHDVEALAEHFDAKSPKISKFLLPILVPLTGLALGGIFARSRRFYFDHFTLAAEISSFYLYFNFFVLPILLSVVIGIIKFFNKGAGLSINDGILMPFTLGTLVWYATIAFHRFYSVSWWRAFAAALLFLIAFPIIVMMLYRLILFSIVMLFI